MAPEPVPAADYVAELEAEVNALRSLVKWATDSNIVLAVGTPEEIAAAKRAYGWNPLTRREMGRTDG